jgi:hypothetical protein
MNAEEVQDRAVTTRPSASANFYVDSQDKNPNQGSGDFSISKNQALFNGFFNRIASAEVVMDWGLPNVAEWWGNNTMTVVNGATAEVISAKIPDGFYTAIQALEAICAAISDAADDAGDALRLAVQYNGLDVKAVSVGVGNDVFYILYQPFPPNNDPTYSLARQLFTSAQLAGSAVQNTEIVLSSPRVLGTTYVDIASPQLTYNQDLKDATTDNNTRDVLYRRYIAQDNVPHERETVPYSLAVANTVTPPWQQGTVPAAPAVTILTETNIPVLQGYTPFVIRRALPYPKQIRWSPEQPIGQVAFQVYDDQGRIINTANYPLGGNFQFQMSLLLSED